MLSGHLLHPQSVSQESDLKGNTLNLKSQNPVKQTQFLTCNA